MNPRKHEEYYTGQNQIKYPTYQEFAKSLTADYAKKIRAYKKYLVYSHYGALCACCGETEDKFLSIDHVNNDGNKDRKRHGGGRSHEIILRIIKLDYPNDYQVLCMNCNTGKARNNGICPHKMKTKLSETLCQKLTDIVEIYIKTYPEEYQHYRKQQKIYQNNLKNPYAEISGINGVVIRELLRLPERFDSLLKLSLSASELIEWCKEVNHVPVYQVWFGNKFPDFRATKGKL